MLQFFYGGEHASVAFQKEQDVPDWDSAIFEAAAEANWTTDPASVSEVGRVLDVRDVRRAVITVKASGAEAYGFTVKNATSSPNSTAWFDLDGGVYTNEEGALFVGVDCLGLEYICVVVDSVGGSDSLAVEMARIPYENQQ